MRKVWKVEDNMLSFNFEPAYKEFIVLRKYKTIFAYTKSILRT